MRISILFLSVFLIGVAFAKKSVVVKVNLTPAGDFQIKSEKIMGSIIKKKSKFVAKKIVVPVNSLESGIDLRDEHLRKRFKKKKIKISNAEGADGKGKATIHVNGIKKEIAFTFEDISYQEIKIKFDLSLKEFGFEGINYMGVGVEDTITIESSMPYKVKN